ncbi:MAG: DUF2252 family protein [Alphaproteobacteria bacterium]|nr:DUF2252 family protein [Alphaproteobacteria bacterium]MCB9694546.1 DUF2252 family protein [Alphaproteobacteria bacterium]
MLTLLLACTSPGDDRAAWLTDALVDDNRVWLSRDPALLAHKYEVMAEDPYDFVRATAGVFLRDLTRSGTGREPSPFPRTSDGAAVLIVGDPHPENLGTLLPVDGPGPTDPDAAPLLYEVVDLDGAVFGPWILDPRRALVGLHTLAAPSCDLTCREGLATTFARAWLDELASPTLAPGDVLGRSAIVDDVVQDALVEGAARSRLLELTEDGPSGRRLLRVPGPVDEGLANLTADEGRQLDRLLEAMPRPAGFRVLDAARRYGGGVASLPALRYVVLFDRGDDGPADDELLQLREVVDPPTIPRPVTQVPMTWDDGADRVLDTHRAAWSRPDADPRLAAMTDGVQVFKALSWSSFNGAIDHARVQRRLAEGRYEEADLLDLADVLGRRLADVQARVPAPGGVPARDTLLAEVDGAEDTFVQVCATDAELDLQRALADHALFVDALDRLGPLLGADRMGP